MAQSYNHTLVITDTDLTRQSPLILCSFIDKHFIKVNKRLANGCHALHGTKILISTIPDIFPAQAPLIKKSHTFYYFSKTLLEAWKPTGGFTHLLISVKLGVLTSTHIS
jgi:hypothetical protein